MNKCHTPITWVNDQAPAINDTNLNQYDGELDTLDDRIITLDTTKAAQSDLLLAFKDVALNSSTGVITFTLFNNTTKTIDTLLEKIAINFDYDDDPTSPHYQNLIIELEDGTYKYIDMSALITEYEFVDSSTVAFTVANDGTVTADVIDGSITSTKLDPAFAVTISNAEANGLKSEGWAVGEQNGTPVTSGSPYYQNNAKWYKEQAQAIAGQTLGGLTDVTITTPTDGQALVYDEANNEWINGSGSYNAEREVSPALKTHAVGDLINVANVTYKVTASITAGDTLTVGTNIATATLDEGSTVYTFGSALYKRFDECTDAEIAQLVSMADAGIIDLETDCGWAVGQEHQISLSAINSSGTYDGVTWSVGENTISQNITLVLMHKGLYELATPVLDTQGQTRNTCSFIVGIKEVLSKGYINSSATNAGSWNGCARRNWCNGGFRRALPNDIRSAFKQFKTVTAEYYSGGGNLTSIDYFALAAEKEIQGTRTYSNSVEANVLTQFKWYETAANRIKDNTAGSELGTNWWGRSPAVDNATFCLTKSAADGSGPNANQAQANRGISPFGCI